MNSYDVCVVGGGTAGAFAAISAARLGARTLLIEKNGFLGGTVTAGRVNFPGLFFAWGRQIISGPCFEAIEKCLALNNKKLPEISYKPKNHWDEQINIDIFTYMHILDEMCISSGVDLLFHSTCVKVKETEEGVDITVACKEGSREFTAKALVDATGDADCVRLNGYEVYTSPSLQPATLINDIDGYDIDSIDEADFWEKYDSALKAGLLKKSDSQGNSMLEQLRHKRLSMHVPVKAPETSVGKGKTEVEARNTLWRLISFLKTVKGLENIFVSDLAFECGIRESVRIKGKSTVKGCDYISGKHYPDSICFSFYPIDLHVDEGIRQIFLKEEVVPEIPFGALMPEGSERIFVGGRCISSDRDANSALRVQATAMATGQAAGCGAYLKSVKNTVDIEELKETLKKLGAIVP